MTLFRSLRQYLIVLPLISPGERPEPGRDDGGTILSSMSLRKGNYGYHHTYNAKLVYQRPKHIFSYSDYIRIGKGIFSPNSPQNKEVPQEQWWMTLMREKTIDMLQIILDSIDLFSGADLDAERVYTAIMDFGNEMLYRWIRKLQETGHSDVAQTLIDLDQLGKK